jgi:CRISPR-associated protein Csd1
MILQDLVTRYEDAGGGELGWKEQVADFAIDLDIDGNVLGIISFQSPDGKKARRTFLLPEEPQGRTVAIKPAFLCDNKGYFFGDKPEKPERGAKMHEASASLHAEILAKVETEAALAVRRFFDTRKAVEDLAELGKYLFIFNGAFVHEDSAVIEAWNQHYSSRATGNLIRCFITGKVGEIARLHGKIMLPGVSMGAVPLVSINSESFASYGMTAKDPAARITEETAFAYTSALNDLLKAKNHRQRLGADTIVFWADGNSNAESDAFSWAMQPEEDPNQVLESLIRAYVRGDAVDIDGCDLNRGFHVLALSPNAGRISVRFYMTDAFGAILKNVVRHYQYLDIVGSKKEKFPHLPPWTLLNETTVGKKSSDVAPLLGGQLLQSILTGQPYPMALYHAILIRAKAGERINRTKAAVVKAVLQNNYQESEVTTVSLNPNSTNRSYVLGRLFSTLERLQQQASGGSLNSTIKDRYFSSSCSNPGSVFPTILKLSAHHLAKLDNSVYFDKLITNLLGRLDEDMPFPTAMSLDDQGRFILGYYHQTQDFFTPKKNKEQQEQQEEQNV